MTEIREAKYADAAAIAEISTLSLGYECEKELVERRLREMDRENQRVYVAADAEKVVGFVQAELYRLLYQEDAVNVLGLAVHPDVQGRGIGKQLMRSVENWATERGCGKVRLNSASGRLKAHAFYEHLGYLNTKSQKRFVKELKP